MESNIISSEQLDAHMQDHSQRLVSEIRNSDGLNGQFHLIRVGVRIYRHDTDKEWSGRTLLYENRGFMVGHLNRWKWYFIFLRSSFQIDTPRQLVSMETYSYVPVDRDQVLLGVLKNKLTAAKRDRTKIQMAIERHADSRRSLFGIENDPEYQKALQVLANKIARIEEIETEIKNLTTP